MLLLLLLLALGRLSVMCDDDMSLPGTVVAACGGALDFARIDFSGVSGEQVGVELTVAADDIDDASLSFLLDWPFFNSSVVRDRDATHLDSMAVLGR